MGTTYLTVRDQNINPACPIMRAPKDVTNWAVAKMRTVLVQSIDIEERSLRETFVLTNDCWHPAQEEDQCDPKEVNCNLAAPADLG